MPCILLVYFSGAKSVRDAIRPTVRFIPPHVTTVTALHWAICVTFNLHVAAYSYEVSEGLRTGAQKFCSAAENTYLLTFYFSTRAQFVAIQFTAAKTRRVSTKCAFLERKLFYFHFIFI